MAQITTSSTAEYFAKNLQQVGFSSPLKAVLTTLKESIDNSLDACESAKILPELSVEVRRVGKGASKSTDLVEIIIEDNGPGIDGGDLAKVFGEYLASSKFGRGQCSRGQQGIGISAATTWAQLTNAKGAIVTSKTKKMRKAIKAQIDVDIKGNKGLLKNKETIDWKKPHGVRVEFRIDGRIQLNGDGGILTYLHGTTLVNPHLSIRYKLLEDDWVDIARVTDDVPQVPSATLPHPHTMKLGEFMHHAGLFGGVNFSKFLKTGFSRVSDGTIKDFSKNGLPKTMLKKRANDLKQADYKTAFQAIQNTDIMNPSTRSVLTVGEEALSKSIFRLGDIDFFSVVTRKPKICDFKPVAVEVAIARFKDRKGGDDNAVQSLRFANCVPLQFDKAACAITKAIESVNWKSYGLQQPKGRMPLGPYVFAVSVVSPFIKFKNASKETIDSSDELVEEIRRALMQAGQKLSRQIRRESREADLERKLQHIESFGPILVQTLARLLKAPKTRIEKANAGLEKLLGRDTKDAKEKLSEAEVKLAEFKAKHSHLADLMEQSREKKKADAAAEEIEVEPGEQLELLDSPKKKKTSKAVAQKKNTKKVAKKKAATKTTKKAAKKTAKKAGKKVAKKTAKKKTTKKKQRR